MDQKMLIVLMMIMIPCYISQSRIGLQRLNAYEDNSGTNWKYIYSDSTLIFDNLQLSTSSFVQQFPLVLIEESRIPNFTLILKNENTILIDEVGSDTGGVNAFEFSGGMENYFIIQGDGKLIIKVDVKKENMHEAIGLSVLNSNLVIKDNVKIEIILNNSHELTGLRIHNGRLYMEGNSQLSVYIGEARDSSIGIECNGVYLSGNVIINSTLLNLDLIKSVWLYSRFNVQLSNYTNSTFITKGTMDFPENFFSYIGKNPIIINAIETLEEFKKSRKLTQKNKNEAIIFSNYFTETESKKDDLQFIKISFFILLNLILLI